MFDSGKVPTLHTSIAFTSTSVQHDGRGSHGLLNVVTQDTALKGRAKRPFLICANSRPPHRSARRALGALANRLCRQVSYSHPHQPTVSGFAARRVGLGGDPVDAKELAQHRILVNALTPGATVLIGALTSLHVASRLL